MVLALIVGSQAISQWNNWILFENSQPFSATDPQFHRNISYFVFRLPFEQFLVHWALVALVVVLLVTALSHYLNGGIRMQGSRPRVRPAVKAHLSVILGLLALVKAIGYYLARFSLDTSSNGYVQGATYTDVHARLPALELLILVSLAATVLLIYNIRRQGWALPILGVGLWFLVALTAGTIYPAAVQALKVNPAQNTLEAPLHPAEHSSHPGRLRPERHPAGPVLGIDDPHRRRGVGQRHAGQRTAVGSDPDRADLRHRPGPPFLLPVQHPGRGPLQGERGGDPGGGGGPGDQRLRSALHLVGQHHPPVHPRLRHDHLPGQRLHLGRKPGVPGGAGAAHLPARLSDRGPAGRLLRARQLRLRGGQHQTARGGLPAVQRQQYRDPLHGERGGAAVQLLRQSALRHPLQ